MAFIKKKPQIEPLTLSKKDLHIMTYKIWIKLSFVVPLYL